MAHKEKFSKDEREGLKNLLNDLVNEVRKIENQSGKITKVDENILRLSDKIDTLSSIEEVDELLKGVENELMILKEYTEYNNLIERFKEEIDKIVKKIVNPTKQELQKLQQIVNKKGNLSPSELKKMADKGREGALSEISGIVKTIEQKGGFWGYIAKLANSD